MQPQGHDVDPEVCMLPRYELTCFLADSALLLVALL